MSPSTRPQHDARAALVFSRLAFLIEGAAAASGPPSTLQWRRWKWRGAPGARSAGGVWTYGEVGCTWRAAESIATVGVGVSKFQFSRKVDGLFENGFTTNSTTTPLYQKAA